MDTRHRPETDPSSPAWQKYYADASRRRRAERRRLGRKTHVDLRKRRRAIEAMFMIGSVLFLGVLTAIFHSVLTR
jgi:hypothetical protein